MVVTAPAAPSLLAGPPAPGRSASRIASDRRGATEVAPEKALFEHLDRAGGTRIGRTRPHRRDSHRARRRFSGQTRNGRYSWARYYHPGLQRFLSQDPIGLGSGDFNLYIYVANAPGNFIDPSGLDKQLPCARGIGPSSYLFGQDVTSHPMIREAIRRYEQTNRTSLSGIRVYCGGVLSRGATGATLMTRVILRESFSEVLPEAEQYLTLGHEFTHVRQWSAPLK